MALPSGLTWLIQTALRELPARRPPRSATSRRWYSALALAILLLGAFVAIVAFALGGNSSTWAAFGASIAVAAAASAMGALGWWRRNRRFELAGLGIAALAIWTIVATAGTFDVDTARWLAFGSGIGFMAQGLVTLVVYEFDVERVVYLLEVRELPPGGSRA